MRAMNLLYYEAKWEWLKDRGNEISDMSWVVWESLFIQLAAIEGKDKQAQSTFKSMATTRKAT